MHHFCTMAGIQADHGLHAAHLYGLAAMLQGMTDLAWLCAFSGRKDGSPHRIHEATAKNNQFQNGPTHTSAYWSSSGTSATKVKLSFGFSHNPHPVVMNLSHITGSAHVTFWLDVDTHSPNK